MLYVYVMLYVICYVHVYVCICVQAQAHTHMWPAQPIFAVCMYMVLRLTTLYWVANKGTYPWKRLIFLLLAISSCL